MPRTLNSDLSANLDEAGAGLKAAPTTLTVALNVALTVALTAPVMPAVGEARAQDRAAGATATATAASAPSTIAPSALLGTWNVDLRPTPADAPYLQEFVVTQVNANNTFEGRFYGAPISQGRINATWGTLRIAFVTADGSGPYHHSAVLKGRTLEGLTNATGRQFLSYWSAVQAAPTHR